MTPTTEAPPPTEPDVCPTQPERQVIYDALIADEITESEAIAATCDYALFDREYAFRLATQTGGDACDAVAGRDADDVDFFQTCSPERAETPESEDALEFFTLETCGDPTSGAAGLVTNFSTSERSLVVNVIVVDAAGTRIADGIDFIRDLAPGQTAEWEAVIPGEWSGTCSANVEWRG